LLGHVFINVLWRPPVKPCDRAATCSMGPPSQHFSAKCWNWAAHRAN
jgi:hypothetical protein